MSDISELLTYRSLFGNIFAALYVIQWKWSGGELVKLSAVPGFPYFCKIMKRNRRAICVEPLRFW